jgi:hypothetical protein
MGLNTILEVAISMVFVFMLLSIIVSSVNEVIVHFLNARGKFLRNALHEVFNDAKLNKNYTDLLYKHPGIDRLKKTARRLPSYISTTSFSSTLIDMIANEYTAANTKFVQDKITLSIKEVNDAENTSTFDRFKGGVKLMKHSDVKILLGSMINGNDTLKSLEASIQTWYNDYMDRVCGWYKAYMQRFLFVIAVVVTMILNIDTIRIVKYIAKDSTVRTELVKGAESYVQNNQAPVSGIDSTKSISTILKQIEDANSQLEAYQLPMGWGAQADWRGWQTLVGWLITAIALSLGAPFWFQVLCKIINIRKSGSKPQDEKPKDE